MKNSYISICFVLASLSLSAQNKNTEKADKLFNRYEYVTAAKEYLKLVENANGDIYVYKQLADTYYNMFNTVEATKWYAKATETPQDAETYYRYAQMLKGNAKYAEANKQMQKFAALAPNDQRAKTFSENPNYLPRLLGSKELFDIKPCSVSSETSDFAALLANNVLYFTSARSSARKEYGWTKEPFLDIYKADYNEDGTLTNIAPVAELNSKDHDGAVSLTKDGNTIYFTSQSFRESSFEKDKKNKLKLGRNNLFKATKEKGKWTNILSLPFNSKAYSISNPSVSNDGKTLYFSSDMPGGIGGVDIWKVSILEADTFSAPENLGTNVNTEGTESFPFIADDNNTLYFASSGRQGFGGLDVFQVDLSKNAPAINLGKPVNTEKDDFAFTFNKAKNIGFISSNRNGNDDIYFATPICFVNVTTVVTNAKTGAILTNAKVTIVDANKNTIASEMSNDNGEVFYKAACEKEYSVQVSKTGFDGNSFAVAKSKGGEVKINAAMQPIEAIITETEIILSPIFFEYDKSNITQDGAFELDKLVQVMQDNPKMVVLAKSHTDNRGSDVYNLNLSDRRAKATVQYILSKGIAENRISGKGLGETEPKIDCKEACTEEEYAQNRRAEFLIVK